MEAAVGAPLLLASAGGTAGTAAAAGGAAAAAGGAATAAAGAGAAAAGTGLFSMSNMFMASSILQGVGSIFSGIQGYRQNQMAADHAEHQARLGELEGRRRQVERTRNVAQAQASINARAAAQGINPGVGAPAQVAEGVSRRAQEEAELDQLFTSIRSDQLRRNAGAHRFAAGGRLLGGFVQAGAGAMGNYMQYRMLT